MTDTAFAFDVNDGVIASSWARELDALAAMARDVGEHLKPLFDEAEEGGLFLTLTLHEDDLF